MGQWFPGIDIDMGEFLTIDADMDEWFVNINIDMGEWIFDIDIDMGDWFMNIDIYMNECFLEINIDIDEWLFNKDIDMDEWLLVININICDSCALTYWWLSNYICLKSSVTLVEFCETCKNSVHEVTNYSPLLNITNSTVYSHSLTIPNGSLLGCM